MAKVNVIREIFSGANGKLSSKRVIGGIAMAVALGCTIYLVIRDGSNSVVENLLMTIFITSMSLLGLPAVTGIWGNSKINIGKPIEEQVDEAPTSASEPSTPNCEECEYKKKFDRKKGTE